MSGPISRLHRLRRLDRAWPENGLPRYFLTLCVERRLHVLANDGIHHRLKDFLVSSSIRYDWWPTRYILMPDHLHLLVHEGRDAVTLGQWVKALKAVVSRRAFKWQSGFFDHLLRSEESESEKWDYVRMNPVRAGLAAVPEDWPYGGEIRDEDHVRVLRPVLDHGAAV